jgi:hypothetical protein
MDAGPQLRSEVKSKAETIVVKLYSLIPSVKRKGAGGEDAVAKTTKEATKAIVCDLLNDGKWTRGAPNTKASSTFLSEID